MVWAATGGKIEAGLKNANLTRRWVGYGATRREPWNSAGPRNNRNLILVRKSLSGAQASLVVLEANGFCLNEIKLALC